jgi:hypothetical protein
MEKKRARKPRNQTSAQRRAACYDEKYRRGCAHVQIFLSPRDKDRIDQIGLGWKLSRPRVVWKLVELAIFAGLDKVGT